MVGNNRSLIVTQDQMEQVGGDLHGQVTGNFNQKVGQNLSLQVGQNLYEKSGTNFAHEAGQVIHLKAGYDRRARGRHRVDAESRRQFHRYQSRLESPSSEPWS